MPTHSPALQALLEPLTTDTWVQCDSCEVWRRVPNYVSERLGDNDQWCVHRTRRLHFERSESLFFPGCRRPPIARLDPFESSKLPPLPNAFLSDSSEMATSRSGLGARAGRQ